MPQIKRSSCSKSPVLRSAHWSLQQTDELTKKQRVQFSFSHLTDQQLIQKVPIVQQQDSFFKTLDFPSYPGRMNTWKNYLLKFAFLVLCIGHIRSLNTGQTVYNGNFIVLGRCRRQQDPLFRLC